MKTRYKNKKNCILAMSLALLVLLSSLPLSAIAIDGEQVSDTVQTIMPVIQDTDLLPFADNFMAANQNIEYTVHYYLQGTTISVAPSKVVVGQTMGAYITESAIVVAGYAAVAPTSVTQTLAATGNEIIFYYTTVDVFYVVHYYVAGTTTTVAPSKTGVPGLMGATVTERAVVVAGYTVDANVKTLTLAGSGNVIIFEYKPSSNFVSGFGSNGKFLTVINTPDMNAIKIYNAQDLDRVRNNLGGSYVLMNDIVDLSTINKGQWIPIGSSDVNAFTGTFDGQGFVIYDLVVTDSRQYVGLFGYTRGATIKNVGLEDTKINIQNSVGSVAMGGLCGYSNGGSISNCYNAGSVYSSSSSVSYVGGVCGYNYRGSISNCYNVGSVSGSSPSYYVGGVCGYNSGSIVCAYWNSDSAQNRNGSPVSNKKGVDTGVDTTTSRNTAQMRDRAQYTANYAEFDFNGVWGFMDGENNDYPILRVFYPSVSDIDITLDENTIVIPAGSTKTLSVTFTPNNLIFPLNTHSQAVIWESNNRNVATVDSNGVVTGLAQGTALITVRSAENPGILDVCEVVVTRIAVNSIMIEPNYDYMWLEVGNSETLTAIVLPDNASNKLVYWSSSDPDVVSVVGSGSNNLIGIVTAHAGGTATITVTSDADSKIVATCEVVVYVPVTHIVLDLTTIDISEGSSDYLTATIYPTDATDKYLYWHSSNPEIVTVEREYDWEYYYEKGSEYFRGILTAVSTGTATIIVTTDPVDFYEGMSYDGLTVAICKVTVSEPTEPGAVNGVTINNSAATISVGNSATLRAVVTPTNAIDKSVEWRSSNTVVATVNRNGLVTAVSEGVATITVTTNDGGFTANCVVTVQPQPPKVTFDTKNSYTHTDAETAIPVFWNVNGLGVTVVSVSRNNAPFTSFTQTTNSISIQPSMVSGLKDVYTVSVTVTNSVGTSSGSKSFEVYNHNSLANELNFPINIDNTNKITGKFTGEIFAMRGELSLSHYIQLNTGSFPWTGQDGLTWQIADKNVAEVYYMQSGGWTKVSADTVLHPTDTLIRIVGCQDGVTTLTVTHKITGLSVEIPVSVVTLENKLYLLTSAPITITEVSYTNGAGVPKIVDTTAFGRSDVALYEQSGIVDEIKFKGTSGGELYLGSIRVSQLYTGEQAVTSSTPSYPVNIVGMRRVTSQTFFTYLPDGRPYNGEVTIYGGLYKNGVFVENSMRIVGQERIAVGRGGSFNILLDSNDFGNININDDLRFAYEVIFADGYAPQLIFVDGFSNNNDNIKFGDAILRLQPWNGQGFTAIQYLYQGIDVTNSNSYVGPDDENPSGVLVANIVSKNEMDVGSFKFIDEFGYVPPNQHIDYTSNGFQFLSGMYSYLSFELTVDETLMLSTGETRHYAIQGRDRNGNVQNVNLPFGIVNGAGWVIPKEMLDFNINLNGVTTDTSFIGTALKSVSGNNNLASDILSKVLTKDVLNLPDGVLPFDVEIKPKAGNPLVYEVKGVISLYDSDKKNSGTVYWSGAGEGKGTYKTHTDQNCPYLAKAKERDDVKSGTVQVAKSKGILGGPCSGGIYSTSKCNSALEDEFEKKFDKAKNDYYAAKSPGSGGLSGSAKVIGYLTAEIGYDIYTGEAVLTLTEMGITFTGKLDYTYSYNIPVPAGPVPVAVTVEFAAGIGLEVTVKVIPTNSAVANNEWIVLEAKTNGYLRLRGAVGVDIWVAAANAGVYGQADLNAEFMLYLLTLEAAARYKVDATVGVDLSYRVGPPIKFFGVKLYTTGNLVLWTIGKWSTGWKPIGDGNQNLFSSGTRAAGVQAFSSRFTILSTLESALLNGVPVNQLPTDEPVVVGDDSFAVAAWSSVNLSEREMELLTGDNNGSGSEPLGLDKVVGVINLSEITVGVFKDGRWVKPFTTLTDNSLPDVSPKVAIFDDKAIVVWQQVGLSEDGENLIVTTTDLWCSLYDGTEWLPIQKINASINGVITDYSVALDDSDVAIVISISEFNDDEVSEGIYTIHIDGFGQVTQSSVPVGTNLNIGPQIVRSKDGFIFSYYTVDVDNGYSDIVLRMIGKDGIISDDFFHSVNTATGLYGISTTFDYDLITNEKGDVVVVWSTYNYRQERYAIYAVQLVEINGMTLFSAPIELDGPQEKDATLTISYSVVSNDGAVNVVYDQIKYAEYAEYLDYVKNPAAYANEVLYPSTLLPASGVFENGFLANIFAGDDVVIGGELPVNFYITNTGVDEITKIAVVWDNTNIAPIVWDNLCILPNTMFTDLVVIAVNDAVNAVPYTVYVTFGNNEVKTETGVFVITNPDVSIGRITVINSEQGRRTFTVNLYSLSTVPLGESDYRVRLSFFKDMAHEIPVAVSSTILIDNVISDPELLALIDEGGLSLPFTYEITSADLNEEGEIPSTGIRLYIVAEIIDYKDNVVPERDYSANNGNVLFESLLRYGQNSVIASATYFDSAHSIVNVALRNNAMNDVPAGSGRIIALLLSETGEILEVKTLPIENTLLKESLQQYQIAFSQSGYDVSINYAETSNGVSDSTLSSLSLSSIPFDFAKTSVAVNGVVKITLDNVYNVPLTSLKAIAKNPSAIITVNGVSYSDVAAVDIQLQKTTNLKIEVTVNNAITIYELTILTEGIAMVSGVVNYQSSTVPATVSLYDKNENLVVTTETANDGSYTLSAPEGNGYTLIVTKPGYLSYTIKNLSIIDGQNIAIVDLTVLGGDINGDGLVDATDLTLFLSSYNTGVASVLYPFTDLNGDGIVDATDLTIFLAGYNKSNIVKDMGA